jgi:hypothetical protein
LFETPRTLEAPPGPVPQICPTPGHTPLLEPEERSAAVAAWLFANVTIDSSTTALAALAHHQDILRIIETLPIARRTCQRVPEDKANLHLVVVCLETIG